MRSILFSIVLAATLTAQADLVLHMSDYVRDAQGGFSMNEMEVTLDDTVMVVENKTQAVKYELDFKGTSIVTSAKKLAAELVDVNVKSETFAAVCAAMASRMPSLSVWNGSTWKTILSGQHCSSGHRVGPVDPTDAKKANQLQTLVDKMVKATQERGMRSSTELTFSCGEMLYKGQPAVRIPEDATEYTVYLRDGIHGSAYLKTNVFARPSVKVKMDGGISGLAYNAFRSEDVVVTVDYSAVLGNSPMIPVVTIVDAKNSDYGTECHFQPTE